MTRLNLDALEVTGAYFLRNLLLYTFGGLDIDVSPISMEEATEKGTLHIEETGEVNSVLLDYRGNEPLFILDGEALAGAWQARVFNTAVWAESSVKEEIPVSCVEEGRWGGNSRFVPGLTSVYPQLRAILASTVTQSLRKTGRFSEKRQGSRTVRMSDGSQERPRQAASHRRSISGQRMRFMSDQRMVWGSVKYKARALSVRSATYSVLDAFEQLRDSVERYVNAFTLGDDVVGLAAFAGGKFLSIDIFPNNDFMKKFKAKLIRGYALDALELVGDFTGYDEALIERYLQKLKKVEMEEYDGVVHGKEFRYMDDEVVVAALTNSKGNLLHLGMFQNPLKKEQN